MALQIQNAMPDLINKQGSINISDRYSGDSISMGLSINFTGSETLAQANSMIKERAKQILHAAISLL
jgi:hypothetical protein